MGCDMDPMMARRYGAANPGPAPSGYPREKTDQRVGRMLHCSPDHAKRLRLHLVPDAIAAIVLCTDADPAKAAAFREACQTALGTRPAAAVLTPDLWRQAQSTDAVEDMAETTYLSDRTPENLAALIRAEEMALAAATHRLRALKAELEAV